MGESSNNNTKTESISFINKLFGFFCICWENAYFWSSFILHWCKKSSKANNKPQNISKVVQCPYSSVYRAELYIILIVFKNFTQPLNLVVYSQYNESYLTHWGCRICLWWNKINLIVLQLEENIRYRTHLIYVYDTSNPIFTLVASFLLYVLATKKHYLYPHQVWCLSLQ